MTSSHAPIMKRKLNSYLNTAFNTGSLALDLMRTFKKRKGSRTSQKPKYNNKMAYGKRYKRSGVTTTQQDVKSTRSKKYNKVKVKKQQAFAAKINAALAPKRELNVYSETYLGKELGPYGSKFNNIRSQIVDDTQMIINSGKGYVTSQDAGYIMGRWQNITGSTDINTIKGSKSVINNNAFRIRVHSSQMNLSITNLPAALIPTLFDIYEFVAAKDIGDDDEPYNTPLKAWKQCIVDAYDPLDGTSKTPDWRDNGQTPYDAPHFGKYWKVLKKTTVYLSPNTTAEYPLHCPAFTIRGDKFASLHAISGITKGLIVIAGIGDNAGWPFIITTPIVRTLVQKTWHFKYFTGESELPQRPTVLSREIP